MCVGILDKKLSRGVLYSFADIDDELGILLEQGLKPFLSPHDSFRAPPLEMMIKAHVSPLQVTLLSAEGEELQNEEYEDLTYTNANLQRLWISREYGEEYASWRLFRPGSCCNKSPVFFPSFTFYAYLAIDPEIMKKTASIRVRLAR